ncbi:phosphoserine transaminase [Pseudactinotalea terrae]|uniref:phosphoserine transaminase n=1 Tax=Pseudactinotalea terrae TaxID=1743262 RepID=UPI0018840C7D|nr:phosphoserine transaminase [Pseudactinotalea terrae]
MTALAIPRDLLPADGRFGCGPSRIRPAQIDALAALGTTLLGTSHRQDPVRSLVGRAREGLATLLGAPEGYEVALGNGGSTAFWDVATFSLIRERAQHATCGEFGAKFAAASTAAPFLAEPQVVAAEPGTTATPVAAPGIDTYAWTHNETSTGVLTPVLRPRGADADALTVVDATSAAGGVKVDLAQTDVYYFAPQKALGSDGGLWFAILSPAAVARVDELSSRWAPASLSLSAALASSRKNETLNTPALATLVLLVDQVEWLLDRGGLDWAAERTATSSAALYDWAEQRDWTTPYVVDPAQRSPVVGTIDLDERIDAKAVAAALRANGVVDVDPYRKLGRNQLRVGMFPSTPPADVEALTRCVDFVVDALA